MVEKIGDLLVKEAKKKKEGKLRHISRIVNKDLKLKTK